MGFGEQAELFCQSDAFLHIVGGHKIKGYFNAWLEKKGKIVNLNK